MKHILIAGSVALAAIVSLAYGGIQSREELEQRAGKRLEKAERRAKTKELEAKFNAAMRRIADAVDEAGK
ncbi:MAG: hypothetical protein MRY74_14670 [Neomegalonema sp.]|nr:hypothetical protein [Neomegalonema sp.]